MDELINNKTNEQYTNKMEENKAERTDLQDFSEKITQLKKAIGNVIVEQQEAVDLLLTAILADGHVLIEGVPGVAKTLLARLVSHLIFSLRQT